MRCVRDVWVTYALTVDEWTRLRVAVAAVCRQQPGLSSVGVLGRLAVGRLRFVPSLEAVSECRRLMGCRESVGV